MSSGLHRHEVRLEAIALLLLAPSITACSSDAMCDVGCEEGTNAAVQPVISCTDDESSLYADPGELPEQDGDIVRCFRGEELTAGELEQAAKSSGYAGTSFTSGALVYKVLYRTERGTEPPTPGYSSAMVYLPTLPRAAELPVVVASHGSRGQADACTPSKFTEDGEYVRDDFEAQVLPLVGLGFAVIAPDLAGYANFNAEGNPPSGYAHTSDVGRSTLDGAKALRNMIPDVLTNDVVLTGHSQGGHSALSALAMAEDYGASGNIAAVALYAPLWLSQRTWGALSFIAGQYPIAESPSPNAVAIWYTYTHAELLDGPGKGVLPFAEEKRDGIKEFVESTCWSSSYPKLEALGETLNDLYDPDFANAIKTFAALGAPCPEEEPAKTTCETWSARYAADRPHLTGSSLAVPILTLYGAKDTTIPPDRFVCATDRLTEDAANFSVCLEEDDDHGSIVRNRADYVSQWIAARTLGETEPSACAQTDLSRLTNDDGEPVTCATIPPND